MANKYLQGMTEIGSNIVARVMEEDAEVKALTGWDGPYVVTITSLGQGGNKTDAGNVTLASTPGKLGAKLRSGDKAVHLTHRALYMPQYQADLARGASGNGAARVKVF